MSSPADIIREALESLRDLGDRPGMHDEGEAALAALTELEQQLAAELNGKRSLLHQKDVLQSRVKAAEAALADANQNAQRARDGWAETENQLREELGQLCATLEQIARVDGSILDAPILARAALDRHTNHTQEAKP